MIIAIRLGGLGERSRALADAIHCGLIAHDCECRLAADTHGCTARRRSASRKAAAIAVSGKAGDQRDVAGLKRRDSPPAADDRQDAARFRRSGLL
jgi:hypothetical protein